MILLYSKGSYKLNNIVKCPNCGKERYEGYKQGYNDAFKLFEKEMINIYQNKSIQYILCTDNVQFKRKLDKLKSLSDAS